MKDALGVGSRLSTGPSGSLAATAFTHELEAAPYLLSGLSCADIAHVVALIACGAIDAEKGAAVLDALLDMHPVPDGLVLDPSVGDLYNNRDAHLRRMLGDEAGLIHFGRARREATTIAWQIAVRERLVVLADRIVDLVTTLLDTAEAHRDTLMTDFTYLHHAHPTTLAHYLLGFAYPFERDLGRVRGALELVNRSPAGSGSVNGSRFDLDRDLLADLLGFDGVVTHTRDAMWAPDMAIETLGTVISTFTTIDRLAEELQLWTTGEFGFLELDDAHSRTSVVMPQKKNPYSLTFLRGEARHEIGRWVGVVAGNMTPTGQPDNRYYAYIDVPAGLDRASAAVGLLAEVMVRATFDTERMSASASEGHSYATDLCDHLALATGLDNRTLHSVVGHAVGVAVGEGRERLRPDDVRHSASELGVDLPAFDDDGFATACDPADIVAVRTGTGGAGEGPVTTMIADLRQLVEAHRSALAASSVRSFADKFPDRVRSNRQ